MTLNYLQLDFHPVTSPKSIVQFGAARFSVLTSKLIRMEYDPEQQFEDRPTQVFWNRNLPTPEFTVDKEDDHLVIETEHINLDYHPSDIGFNPYNLAITLNDTGLTWHYGMENKSNLLGTVRTLDEVNGATALEPGLISRNGWSVVDDSHSLVFADEGWLAPRESDAITKDLYFFGYGHSYTDCIVDFQRLSGKTPIIPRFALGNWWSRYWAYTQDELTDLMQNFKAHEVPLSVCIIDMDWHIVDTGNESSGWTGYTWNSALFPDPDGFLVGLHNLGLKTALNLHPALGIHPHEQAYPAMAERLGVDPKTKAPIPFDIANPDFTEAYFDLLHHPLEEMGVDFWWMDWQQGTNSSLAGLDPLFWLNHLHFYDRHRDGVKRPFIFSRWGGLGSQRYPIGFSGDTIVSWESLQFQPYFTATAANVSYGWWSHDIGGHMGGVVEPELYLRWLQYGVFSPIMRLHSTNNPYQERRPWAFDAETTRHATRTMQLRHALIPYLYSAAWKNYTDGILPIRPMYHLYPEENDAYLCPTEYAFGSELIAAPFTTPQDVSTQSSRQVIWLPEGDWFDFAHGEHYAGNGWISYYGTLADIPVFAKAGAILPMGPLMGWENIASPKEITLHIYPGADNVFELYEDDGVSTGYQQGKCAITRIEQKWLGSKMKLFIEPPANLETFSPNKRTYQLIFHSLQEPGEIVARLNGKVAEVEAQFIANEKILTLSGLEIPPGTVFSIEASAADLMDRSDHRKARLDKLIQRFRLDTYAKDRLHHQLDEFLANPTLLMAYADYMTQPQLLAFIETWLGTQPELISSDPNEAFNRIINRLYGH
ncbi:MAG: DUF5110 domain-containing protein [Anaerolineaceae bacterium]|nr:DUF5110 domain-containing protein [Anaerolineaceae bacterium]